MKNFFFIAFILLAIPFVNIAQRDLEAFEKTMEMKVNTSERSWVYRNVFVDYKLGAVSEFFYVPTKTYEYWKGDYEGDDTPELKKYVDAGFMLSIFNITLEPRVNLYSKNDQAVFLKAPLTFGLSILGERKESNLMKSAGVFNVNAPILIGFGKGLNSTFTNVSKRGFAISAGYQFMRMPLVGGKSNELEFYADRLEPIGEPYALRKSWGMPLIQLDYYKRSRKNKIRGYSAAFCPYGNFYIKLAMNFAGTKK
jgi:hypothetical protein